MLTDGFRHAADAAVAPPLHGCTTPVLFARHGLAGRRSSPFGDLSSLRVSLWQADALLVAVVTGALAVAASPGSPAGVLVLAVVVAGLLLAGLRRRLRRL